MDTGGSNLNAGSTSSTTATYSSASGDWDGTSIFTPNDGSTPASSVSINDWLSVYPNGNSTTPYVAQVTAVAAGANGAITLSTTLKFGTAPTSSAGTHNRSAKAGGAWADFGMVASGVALNTGTVTQPTRVNIKATGTANVGYNNGATARTFALAGTALLPLWWRGYTSAAGDADNKPSSVDDGSVIPLITTSAQLVISGGGQIFENISIRSTTTTANGAVSTTGQVIMVGVRIENTAANSASRALTGNTNPCFLFRCWLKATATAATVVSVSSSTIFANGCWIVGGIVGMTANAFNFTPINCLFTGHTGDGLLFTTGAVTAVNCSFYGGTSGTPSVGNGMSFTGASTGIAAMNCHFENYPGGSKAAINNSSGTNILGRLVSNSYYNCTAYTAGITETLLLLDVGQLGASGFTNAAGGDFTAGTGLKAVAMPGNLENSTLIGYLDNGALQRVEPAGGGPVASNFRGGFTNG